jgi:hypothetical protein
MICFINLSLGCLRARMAVGLIGHYPAIEGGCRARRTDQSQIPAPDSTHGRPPTWGWPTWLP